MQMSSIDMQRISMGALIVALALMVDDAMTPADAMLSRMAEGDDKVQAATFAFSTYAFAMLAGTLVTIAGFVRSVLRSVPRANIHSRFLPWWPLLTLIFLPTLYVTWFSIVERRAKLRPSPQRNRPAQSLGNGMPLRPRR